LHVDREATADRLDENLTVECRAAPIRNVAFSGDDVGSPQTTVRLVFTFWLSTTVSSKVAESASSVTGVPTAEPPRRIASPRIDGSPLSMIDVPDPMMTVSPVCGTLPDTQLAAVNQSPTTPVCQV
jgi:hypothetical protein